MARPFLAASLALAALSVAAGLADPVEPLAPNHLFVASPESLVVYEFDGQGVLQPNLVTGLTAVHDLAFGPGGALYASDVELDQVLSFDETGAASSVLAPGSGIAAPTDLGFGPDGRLWVASSDGDAVLAFDRDGQLDQTVGAGSDLDDPRGLAFGPDGHLFVSSAGTDEVLEFDPSGLPLGSLGEGVLVEPWGLAFGSQGHLFVASHGSDEVLEFDADRAVVGAYGEEAGLLAPTAIAFGPERLLYVASEGTDDVRALDGDGALVATFGGDTDLTAPTGLAFSPFVLGAKLNGHLERSGADGTKLKAKARLSYAPGAGIVTLLLVDADPELIDLFGSDVLTFFGYDARPDPIKQGAAFVGNRITGDARQQGQALVALEIDGKLDDDGRLQVKKFKGDLQWAGPGGVFTASLKKTGKLP